MAGNTIKSVTLEQNFPDEDPELYLGHFVVPTTPLRIVVEGQDDTGAPHRRQSRNLYRAQPVVVYYTDLREPSVFAGEETQFTFLVRNLAESAPFDLSATSTSGFETTLSVAAVTLAQHPFRWNRFQRSN